MLKMRWIISPYTVKQATFDLQQKETGSKIVAKQHQNMHHVAYFLVYNVLAKFQLFCIITCRHILYFVFWLPYCHTLWCHQYLICIIQKLWISLERYEIWQKGKHHSSSLLKAFQIHLFFNTSIFHFIGTLKEPHTSSYSHQNTFCRACANKMPLCYTGRQKLFLSRLFDTWHQYMLIDLIHLQPCVKSNPID